ncbi:MAG: hypothetical protein OES32_00510 [Acidobacteriota bacterium]|nr:hypothetical protein [Acidobacteriota bacterium]
MASTVLILLLLTPSVALGRSNGDPTLGSPEATTRLLKNRTARIYLTSGEVVAEAKRVEVGQCTISWQLGGQAREVPAGEVQSITALKRSRGLRGLVIGSGIGVGLGAMSAGDANSGTTADAALGPQAFVLSVLVAAPVGWGIGTLAKQPEREVYSAAASGESPGLRPSC